MAITVAMASIPNLKKTSRNLSVFGVAIGLTAVAASEARAEFNAGISLGLSRTDNVFLEPTGDEQDDTFYNVSPFVRWSTETPALDGLLDYRYDRYDYQDTDLDQSWHYLNTSLTGKAMEESLRFKVGASRRQVLENPQLDILPGQQLISGNLIDLDQLYVEPSFDRTYGRATSLLLRYRYTASEYDLEDAQTQDETQDAQFNLNNYAAGQGLTWSLRYDFIRTEYEDATFLPFEYQKGGGELGFWTSDNLRVFAGGGKESQWDEPVDRSPRDPYWEAGFAYRAADRINVEAAAGERSFGESLRASLSYDFRRGSTTLRYREQPTTEGFNRRRTGDPINPQDPDDFLTNPGLAERFISNRFDWSFTLTGRRTGFRIDAFFEERTGQFAADGTPIDDENQSSVNARFSWEAGTRTEFVLDGTFINREFGEEGEDDLTRGRAAINYRVGSKTTLSLLHEYTKQDSAGQRSGATRDYTANTTSLTVTFSLTQD